MSKIERNYAENEKFTETPDKVLVNTNPFNDFNLSIAKGDVSGHEIRGVFGKKLATTTEGTTSDTLTGLYPFPTIAAQMDLVSTDTDDALAGIGAQVILIRGLIISGSDWVVTNEVIALDGTNIVTTLNSWIRINSISVLSSGASIYNQGIITISNGADILQAISPGENLSMASVWSIASNQSGYIRRVNMTTAKSVNNSRFTFYLHLNALGFPPLVPFKYTSFDGENQLPFTVPFTLGPMTDFVINCESLSATTNVTAYFELTLVTEI